MARISDIIADFINDKLNEKQSNEVVIQRNDLADKFNCAPSQINYVLTTRFTCEKGYVIESRRGGGGYIIIKKVQCSNRENKIQMLNKSIGDSMTYQNSISLINYLLESELITKNEYEIIKISINDRVLSSVEDKNKVRADMLKGMIMVILS